MTVSQALSGRRLVQVNLVYFYLDRQTEERGFIPASPLGMGSRRMSQISDAIIIEGDTAALPREFQQPPPDMKFDGKVNGPK